MNQAIQDFINCKRLAVVGVSRNSQKFGQAAFKELQARGYTVYPVNPSAETIDGVVIIVPSQQAVQVLHEAASLGLRHVWLQKGAESAEVLAAARQLELEPVSGKCVLMYAPPVRSYHAWHRGFVRLIGGL